jgi:hypothetical protein
MQHLRATGLAVAFAILALAPAASGQTASRPTAGIQSGKAASKPGPAVVMKPPTTAGKIRSGLTGRNVDPLTPNAVGPAVNMGGVGRSPVGTHIGNPGATEGATRR